MVLSEVTILLLPWASKYLSVFSLVAHLAGSPFLPLLGVGVAGVVAVAGELVAGVITWLSSPSESVSFSEVSPPSLLLPDSSFSSTTRFLTTVLATLFLVAAGVGGPFSVTFKAIRLIGVSPVAGLDTAEPPRPRLG